MLNGKRPAVEHLDERHAQHDAKHAVERAGIRHGVEMRADEERWALRWDVSAG